MRILRAYGIAALSVTLALLGTLLIAPVHHRFQGLLFFLAIFISAWGGLWPGVFATLLSVALIGYFLMEPVHSFALSSSADLVPIFLFTGVGISISLITHRLDLSREALRKLNASLEQRVAALMEAEPCITFIAHDPECRQMTSNPAGLRALRLPAGANSSLGAPEGRATRVPRRAGRPRASGRGVACPTRRRHWKAHPELRIHPGLP